MIAAQVLCVVAFTISWIWWVIWLISLAALIFFQIMWCCRQSKAGIIAATTIATLAGALCVTAACIMLFSWENATFCAPFALWADVEYNDDYDYDFDLCPERAYATIAFVDAAFWFATAACTFTFLKSGRHARMEAALVEKSRTGNGGGAVVTAVEMGNVHNIEQVVEDVGYASATPVCATYPATFASSEPVGKVDIAK